MDLLREKRVAAVEAGEDRRITRAAGALGWLEAEPCFDLRVGEAAVARVVENFQRGIAEALGGHFGGGGARLARGIAGHAAEPERGEGFGEGSIPPRGVGAVAGEDEQPTALIDEKFQRLELVVAECGDVREHHDGGLRDALRVESVHRHDFGLDEIGLLHFAGEERRERDLGETRLALEVVGRGAGRAVHEQHAQLFPHGDAGEVAVVGLDEVGLGFDLDDVRAGFGEDVREEHLPGRAGGERKLRAGRAGLFPAIDLQRDAEVGAGGVAEVADVRADLHFLADADHKLGKVERLDGDVLFRLHADIPKRDGRRELELLQPVQRLGEYPLIRGGKADFLEVGEQHDLPRVAGHFVERARHEIERRAERCLLRVA